MADFHDALRRHTDLSYADQVAAGQPLCGDMPPVYVAYLQRVVADLDAKRYDAHVPRSLVAVDAYAAASEMAQGRLDLVLTSLADLLRHIEWFYRNPSTPNACPQLRTMLAHLWEMLDRLGSEAMLCVLPPPPPAHERAHA
jgi:hypothetical protein